MNGVLVYPKDGCPFCSLLKSALRTRRIEYTEFNLSDDSIRAEFYANTGTSTVPQLFLVEGDDNVEPTLTVPTGRRIGGWKEVSSDWQVFENK